eukprot:gene10988-8516_t
MDRCWEAAAHRDLARFLTLRAAELATGGELLFTHAMPGDAKPIVLPCFAAAVGELLDDGTLDAAAAGRLTPCYLLRTEEEVRAAAAERGVAAALELVSLDVVDTPYPQRPPHSPTGLDAIAAVFCAPCAAAGPA